MASCKIMVTIEVYEKNPYYSKSSKANSVQEPCIKCLVVYISKYEIWQTNKKMEQKGSVFSLNMLEKLKTKAINAFCFVFHVGFKISNFNV